MRKNLVFTSLVALMAAGGAAHSQDLTSAVLAARVTSAQGQPLQGVRVQVESPALLGSRSTVTDANGSFRMPLLPSGQAKVTYSLEGYLTRQLTVTLTAGQVSNANATLTPIAVQEATVEISGGSTAHIDKTDTVVQASFTNEQMNVLMRAGDLNNAHALVPAVASATLYGRPIIRGGTGRAYKILYNGVPVGDQFGGGIYSQAGQDNLFLQDMVESFAVLLSPSNARYGNSDGGVTSFVSKKGGNEFKGTLRVADMRRGDWNVTNEPYPRRDGSNEGVGVPSPPSDSLSRRFEFTIEGPIWKDRLSFAYGGVLRPTTYTAWWPGRDIWSVPEPRYIDYAGTFFQNQYGDIVRRSELGVRSDVNTLMYWGSQATHDQFSLFYQITPSHQVEYLYKEATVSRDYWGRSQNGDDGYLYDLGYTDRVDRLNEPTRDWSIGYKGIIGQSGVLDFRVGKHTYLTELTNAGGRRITINTLPSYVPYAGMGALGDASNFANFDAYHTNGFVQSAYKTDVDFWYRNSNALDNDTVDGGITTSIMLNYQHYLSAAVGNHTIDVGYQSDHLNWLTKIYDNAQYTFFAPGRLPMNLTEADVYRAAGGPPIGGDRMSASAMAGRYIVWNMRYATLGSIDPEGLQWAIANSPNINGDQPLYPEPTNSRHLYRYYPRLVERYGNDSGKYWTQMQSFYLNDLWTINDSHGVMLGLRLDNFKVWDSVRDVHSYTQPSFRFNYTWDVYGDQSRLVTFGLNQYHAQVSANIFYPFLEARMLNSRTMYWDRGPDDGRPYLVTQEELMEPSNYGYRVSDTVAGSMGGKIDSGFKMPVSTELSIGFAKNFSNGGSFKISYNQRSWSNLYDIYPGDTVAMPNGLNQMQRVLKNTTEFERSYKDIEIEWSVPIASRLEFGGNYTFARLMSNQSGISTTETDIRGVFNTAEYQMVDHWNQFWPREAWNATLLLNTEHMLNWWFTCDMSSGKAKSSIALRGRYDSNYYRTRYYGSTAGRPIIDGVYDYNGNLNTTGLASGKNIIVGKSKDDAGWNTTLRYNLELPMYRKLAWFATAEISNPFNHRGRSASGVTGFGMPTSEVLESWTEPDGTNRVQNLDPYNGNFYQANANYWSYYMGRMGGRSLTLQTGLRF